MSNDSSEPVNPYKFYQKLSTIFSVVEKVLSSNAESLPLECQNTRKVISWVQLNIALGNAQNSLMVYQNDSSTSNSNLLSNINKVQEVIDRMLANPNLYYAVHYYLKDLEFFLQSFGVSLNKLQPGESLPKSDIDHLGEILFSYNDTASWILVKLPMLIQDALDFFIKDLETAIEAYQDGINKNISAGDLLVLKDSMVDRLQAIQGEAIILLVLELVGPKGSLFELFTTLKDAPSKLLQNITNEVDFKDDMVQLLVRDCCEMS